jgi:adenylate kinase
LAKEFIDRGELVPDDLTIEIVRERLSTPDAAKGVVLDGFPRTKAQAEALDTMLGGSGVDLVLNIEVPADVAKARMIERARLEGRTDDVEEAIARRLALYEAQTQPLLEYYSGRVATVDGLGTVDEVFERCLKEAEAATSP